jgi:hypothetical protein
VSRENLEIVQRLLARVNEQNLDAAVSDIAPEAQLDTSASEAPDSGIYRGPEEWGKWMAGRWEGLSDARFDVAEVIDVPPDTVVLVARMLGRGRASGVEIAALGVSVWTLRNRRVTGATLYQTKDQALKAAGLQK